MYFPTFGHSNLPCFILSCLNYSDFEQRLQPNEPLSTVLCAIPSSIDFATRAAKIVTRRTEKPTYIGCSVGFGNATVEEELAVVKAAVAGILSLIEDKSDG